MSNKVKKGSRKGSSDEYENSGSKEEDQHPKKQKTNSGQKQGIKIPAKKKTTMDALLDSYKFSKADDIVMLKAINEYGNKYSTIQKEYFPNLKPKIIQNHIQHTKDLKNALDKQHADVRERTRAKFDSVVKKEKENQKRKKKFDSESSSDDEIEISDSNSSSSESDKEIMHEGAIHQTREPPFTASDDNYYVFFFRHHLAQRIDLDFDFNKRMLVAKFISHDHLFPSEYIQTPWYINVRSKITTIIDIYMSFLLTIL